MASGKHRRPSKRRVLPWEVCLALAGVCFIWAGWILANM